MRQITRTFPTAIGLPALAIAGAVWAGGPAMAAVVSQSATVPLTTTNWSTNAEIGQFDPSLGSLHSISFGLSGTLQGSIGIENLEPTPTTVYSGLSSTIALSPPGAGQVLAVTPYVGADANLGAFDGSIDFAGASGRTFANLTNTQSVATTYTAGAGGPQLATAPYIGTGNVALPVSATANAGISGPLDLAAYTQAAAGANVSVTYRTASNAPSGGGYDTFGASGATLGMNRNVSAVLAGTQQTPVQTRTLSDQNGDWTRNVTFTPFNTALGTLVSANLTLSGDVKASLSLQNTGRTAGSYNVDQSVLFSLLGPGGELLDSTGDSGTLSGWLNPFAGSDNFTGPFGTTIDDTLWGWLQQISDGNPADLAFFSDTDPLTLAVEAIGSLSAELPGNADLLSSALEGAQVSLSYTYLPDLDPPAPLALDPLATATIPEPASFALLLSAIAGFGLLRRRQGSARTVGRIRRAICGG